ncbi:hypothetical protein PR001_g25650 [Phytophthora rubi]|uniref:Uncharacterized protein n=1 Tax=Phytophthora rubi TaxID=129364 RepID=A0A6A3I0G2_9STRA|nr:hypothetical protein PR002_g25896 [Phytophthora rubi]KAE8975615.1 hypothetical protein PR001_g25650 [Phytophthora rubi]
MAQYARETVYVLDVREHGSTWLQAYAYAEAADQGGEAVETGTVTPMDTRVAMKMLHDMVANGVMPPCMVLQWRETGNHFQALTYDEEKYKTYADNLPAMVSTRNSIRVQHGEQALDAVPYDELKNARAAAQTLKVIRKKSKVTMKLEQAGTRLGTDSRSDGGNEGSAGRPLAETLMSPKAEPAARASSGPREKRDSAQERDGHLARVEDPASAMQPQVDHSDGEL